MGAFLDSQQGPVVSQLTTEGKLPCLSSTMCSWRKIWVIGKGHCVEINIQTERQRLCDPAYRKNLKMVTLRYTEDNMVVTRAVKK